ncbi:tail fiber assembly protein [Neisseriaceae bacterium ESL0693]|nr:tail fiber assembly protein [Neisseriaceae bacterium ESL0693]
MQIYSLNENTYEVLINTLREADYIDACTPAIPVYAVIADAKLPEITAKQALVVTGARNAEGYFTVSSHVQIVEDHRDDIVYSTKDGQMTTIQALGSLPDDVTTLPRPDKYHIFVAGNWVMTAETKAQQEADAEQVKQAEITNLLNNAAKKIGEYQDLIDFADTAEEQSTGEAGLNSWRQYRAALLKYQKGLITDMPTLPTV